MAESILNDCKQSASKWITALFLLGLALPGISISSANDTTPLAPLAVTKFYESRNEAHIWKKNKHYDDLLLAIENLADHGLNPDHYHLQALRASRTDAAKRERLATDAWFSAAAHMVYGKLDPTSYEPDWSAARRNRDLALDLSNALDRGTILNSLNNLAPLTPEYHTLVSELDKLRHQDETSPVTIPNSPPALRPGKVDGRVDILQKRLIQLGLLSSSDRSGTFDSTTETAVRRYQASMGLTPDGVVGANTITRLNVSRAEKIDQVRVNLERWRWLPDDLGRRHIRANIADFSVYAFNNGVIERKHSTIVGRLFHKTPVFSDEVEYVVLNPWWETPQSIARRDKLPLFKKDPTAIERLGFKIVDGNGAVIAPDSIDWTSIIPEYFPYRIRQSPGPLNALGRVKIMFPNKHDIYLHDTPERGLFSQDKRTFSSGCIRVQDPKSIVLWLLDNSKEWGMKQIDARIASGETSSIKLSKPVPIHILYFTVYTDDSGKPQYLGDVYDRDENVLTGLDQPSS